MTDQITMTHDEWTAEAKRRFGEDPLGWAFVCPCCGFVATPAAWKAAGAPSSAVAFSCVGRWLNEKRDAFEKGKSGPCNYAGGGLIHLNPVTVKFPDGATMQAFDFAPAVDHG